MKRVLLPLGLEPDDDRAVMPASVLAAWFDASIQPICIDEADGPAARALTGTLGRPTEPLLVLDEPIAPALAAHAHAVGPALIVVRPTATGRAVAAESTQPVLLVADGLDRRLPSGAIVADLTGPAHDAETDVLAVAATAADRIGLPVRLVVDDRPDAGAASDRTEPALRRLAEIGVDGAIDRVTGSGDDHPAVVVARTRGAVFLVVARNRLDQPNLVDAALASGVNVLVAPATAFERVDPARRVTRPGPDTSALPGSTLEILPRRQCYDHLAHHSIGRLGYVEAGWPIIVPVNYRVAGETIFIRSREGGKLQAAEWGQMFCFEVDGFSERLRTGWSVVAHGKVEPIDDPAVLRQAWDNDPQPWVEAERWRWLRLEPMVISGRRAEPGADPDVPDPPPDR